MLWDGQYCALQYDMSHDIELLAQLLSLSAKE